MCDLASSAFVIHVQRIDWWIKQSSFQLNVVNQNQSNHNYQSQQRVNIINQSELSKDRQPAWGAGTRVTKLRLLLVCIYWLRSWRELSLTYRRAKAKPKTILHYFRHSIENFSKTQNRISELDDRILRPSSWPNGSRYSKRDWHSSETESFPRT